jgi:hypothetical protein
MILIPRHQALKLLIINTNPPLKLPMCLKQMHVRRIRHQTFDIREPFFDRLDDAPPELIPTFPARLVFATAMQNLQQSLQTLRLLGTVMRFQIVVKSVRFFLADLRDSALQLHQPVFDRPPALLARAETGSEQDARDQHWVRSVVLESVEVFQQNFGVGRCVYAPEDGGDSLRSVVR